MIVNLFVQARMSSSRFPGKMLAQLHDRPLIAHVVDRCRQAGGIDNVVVLTSTQASDDPLVAYMKDNGIEYFRGSLDPVYTRFKEACAVYAGDYFVRISGDSPLIEPALITDMVGQARTGDYDFLSNVWLKKFPKGQSVEIIKYNVFNSLNDSHLTAEQTEHVMPYFYEHQQSYRTYFMDNPQNCRELNCCVDTPEDLENIRRGLIQYHYRQGEQLCRAA